VLLNKDIPGRSEMVAASMDLINNLHALEIPVLLAKEADAEFVRAMAPDVVVIATGGKPLIPNIQGIQDKKVVLAWDVLSGKARVGRKVVIVGGNAVGLDTALYLANQGTISPEVLHFLAANKAETWETLESLISKGNKDVTVVEMLQKYGKDIGLTTRWTILGELKRLGVKILTGAKAIEVRAEGLQIEKGGKQDLLEADTIVIAAGTEPLGGIKNELGGLVPEIYAIGDANEPRKALDAIREGFLTGLKI